jgi:hypothetical protein
MARVRGRSHFIAWTGCRPARGVVLRQVAERFDRRVLMGESREAGGEFRSRPQTRLEAFVDLLV